MRRKDIELEQETLDLRASNILDSITCRFSQGVGRNAPATGVVPVVAHNECSVLALHLSLHRLMIRFAYMYRYVTVGGQTKIGRRCEDAPATT